MTLKWEKPPTRRDLIRDLVHFRDASLETQLDRHGRAMVAHARICQSCLRCREATLAVARFNAGTWPP